MNKLLAISFCAMMLAMLIRSAIKGNKVASLNKLSWSDGISLLMYFYEHWRNNL